MTQPIIDAMPAVPSALEKALEDGLRGRELLELALREQTDMLLVTYIITNLYSGSGEERFTWMEALERTGHTKAQLMDMLYAMFRAEDPNADIASHHKADFLRVPGSWRMFENADAFIDTIKECLDANPGCILEFANQMAAKIGALQHGDVSMLETAHKDALQRYERAGQNEVMNLVRQAYRKVRVLNAMAQVDTALKLLPKELSSLCDAIIARAARTNHLTRPEVVLFAVAHASAKLNVDTERAVEDALFEEFRYRPPRTNPPETEDYVWHRPVRLYRWILWAWKCYPVKATTALTMKQAFRKILLSQGWHFTLIAEHEGRQGHELRAEVQLDGGRKNVYIVPRQPDRDDAIDVGHEVIVPQYVNGHLSPLYTRANERGYIYEMHPARPPCPSMMREVERRTNY